MTAFARADLEKLAASLDGGSAPYDLEKPTLLDTRLTFQHYNACYAAPWPLPLDGSAVECEFIGYADAQAEEPAPAAAPADPDALPEPLK